MDRKLVREDGTVEVTRTTVLDWLKICFVCKADWFQLLSEIFFFGVFWNGCHVWPKPDTSIFYCR